MNIFFPHEILGEIPIDIESSGIPWCLLRPAAVSTNLFGDLTASTLCSQASLVTALEVPDVTEAFKQC